MNVLEKAWQGRLDQIEKEKDRLKIVENVLIQSGLMAHLCSINFLCNAFEVSFLSSGKKKSNDLVSLISVKRAYDSGSIRTYEDHNGITYCFHGHNNI